MSTIDEVLATAEVVDAVCVIDGETRIISVPNEYKELGVESDEKVTRIKFQCPKIVGDNVDLTEYNLYINYRNAANKLNSYLVEDVTVTDDTINFSWLLSRHVTESPGTISYIVCAKKSDYTGVINEWNTKVATGTVGVGLEATEEIEEQNIDIIEQILRSIVELENNTGGSGVSDYDLLDNKPIANITSTTNNVISLRDLPTGVYRLSGDFIPYAGSNRSFSFANKQLVNVITNDAGTNVQILYPIDNTIQFVSIMVDQTAEDGYSLEQINVKLNDLQTKSQMVTISLPASSWVEEGSIYKQTVAISSATSTSQVDLRPSQEQLQNMIASGISLMTANDNGTVTVFSIGGVPATDYSIQAIVSEANTVGGASGTQTEFAAKITRTFKTQAIGELFDHPENYTAWCSGSLHYDDKLCKFVDLLYAAPKHENPAYTVNYVTYIDPKTYEATTPVLCKYYDTDGSTELTITKAGRPAFVILRDGSYMMLQTIGSTNYRFISTDYGLTWVKGESVTGYSGSTETYALVQLSNGRILANAISRVINYSDDDGKTWTSVTPVTSGASYEAEYCFLEVKSGVVLGICRKTVGGVGRTESGDAEHAVITVSRDYGTTWSDLKESETIDNMNASTCTGFIHDGIVEIFAASRWYHSGNYAVTDYLNTGKSGAITHYVATIDNALNDKFTKMGVIAYAKTTGETSPLAAQDFHTPCIAVNGNDMLMVYFDRVHPYDVVDMTNHYYIRGSLDGIDYGVNDDIQSKIFPVSSVKIDALLRKLKNELIVKINEAIISGGIIPPSEDENGNPGTYIMDGVLVNFNFTDSAAINTNNMTVTDSIHRVAASCTSEIFPEIRENSLAKATFNIPALGDYYGSTSLGKGFTIEISVYHYESDTFNDWHFWGIPKAAQTSNYYATGKYTRDTKLKYVDTDGATQSLSYWAEWFGRGTTALGFYHIVIAAGIDGVVNLYKNGECITTLIPTNFASWTAGFEAQETVLNEYLKTYRVYSRALTAEEVASNYKYELATIV